MANYTTHGWPGRKVTTVVKRAVLNSTVLIFKSFSQIAISLIFEGSSEGAAEDSDGSQPYGIRK